MHAHPSLVIRVLKAQRISMQMHRPLNVGGRIDAISTDRSPHGSQMRPQLMGSARERPQPQTFAIG